MKHLYLQPLKYSLVPHKEKWFAHSRSDVIKLQIMSIMKPHGRLLHAFPALSLKRVTKLGTNRLRQ